MPTTHHPTASCRIPRVLRVVTDFSGMETPVLALKKLDVRHAHLSSSDSSTACRKVIKHVFKPKRVLSDVRSECKPSGHLYIYAQPCQVFSSLGKNGGTSDPRCLWRPPLRYILKHRPRVIISENVSSLFFKHRLVLKGIVRKMRRAGYKVRCRILNTADHGVRQSRRRLYLVAIRADSERHTFQWPNPIKFVKGSYLEAFNAETDRRGKLPSLEDEGPRPRTIVSTAYKRLMRCGTDPRNVPMFSDIDSSERFASSMVRQLPCMTASRGASRGFWVSMRGRRILLPAPLATAPLAGGEPTHCSCGGGGPEITGRKGTPLEKRGSCGFAVAIL